MYTHTGPQASCVAPPALIAAPTTGLAVPHFSGHAPPNRPPSPHAAASHVRPYRIGSAVSSALLAAGLISTASSAVLYAGGGGVPPSSRTASSAILGAACALLASIKPLPTQQDTR
eukprot:GHVU01013573.1.p1 GENE.GHVU01013573.1~~GHVU01013573.1.p1  ORF type:complete len:116 (+),score=10.34 GHVU01013573.1:3-350(+)